MKVFECLCYATTLKVGRRKFALRGRKCVFLLYSFEMKGYKLLELEINLIFVSRDVVFHELVFPIKQSAQVTSQSDFIPTNSLEFVERFTPVDNNESVSFSTSPNEHLH